MSGQLDAGLIYILQYFNRREVNDIRTLKFIINGQILEKDPNCDFSYLVPGTANYLKAEFDFSPEWDGYKKVVEFSRFNTEYPPRVLTDGKSCMIPVEVTEQEAFRIRILGGKDDKNLATNSIIIVQNGGGNR